METKSDSIMLIAIKIPKTKTTFSAKLLFLLVDLGIAGVRLPVDRLDLYLAIGV